MEFFEDLASEMRAEISSHVDPPSRLALSLTSRSNFASSCPGTSCLGIEFADLCCSYGYVELLKWAVECGCPFDILTIEKVLELPSSSEAERSTKRHFAEYFYSIHKAASYPHLTLTFLQNTLALMGQCDAIDLAKEALEEFTNPGPLTALCKGAVQSPVGSKMIRFLVPSLEKLSHENDLKKSLLSHIAKADRFDLLEEFFSPTEISLWAIEYILPSRAIPAMGALILSFLFDSHKYLFQDPRLPQVLLDNVIKEGNLEAFLFLLSLSDELHLGADLSSEMFVHATVRIACSEGRTRIIRYVLAHTDFDVTGDLRYYGNCKPQEMVKLTKLFSSRMKSTWKPPSIMLSGLMATPSRELYEILESSGFLLLDASMNLKVYLRPLLQRAVPQINSIVEYEESLEFLLTRSKFNENFPSIEATGFGFLKVLERIVSAQNFCALAVFLRTLSPEILDPILTPLLSKPAFLELFSLKCHTIRTLSIQRIHFVMKALLGRLKKRITTPQWIILLAHCRFPNVLQRVRELLSEEGETL